MLPLGNAAQAFRRILVVAHAHSGFGGGGGPAAPARPPANSFWADAYRPLPWEERSRATALVLIELQGVLTQRLVQLHAAEARLGRTVGRKRRKGGILAVRLMEMERQRLGRELHTGVGQLLASIHMQIELIGEQLPNPSANVERALRNIAGLAAEALDEVRSISRRLHPPAWQGLPLDAALTELWETSGVAQRFTGDISVRLPVREADPDVKTLLYRAAQEALSNIVRHARAKRVDLKVEAAGDRVILTVRDDGVGFDPSGILKKRPDAASGIGLSAIRQQAAGLGGELLVRSGPHGTTLEVSVPLLS
jgi:two-component system, NarL family, sensor kinase